MNILLAYTSGAPDRTDPYLNLLPSGLCYLHASLRAAGFRSRLANFSAWPRQAVRHQLTQWRPDLIGISQWTHNRHQACELARMARQLNPDCLVVMGGGHATFRYAELLRSGDADLVVLGEGEETLKEIAERLSDGGELRGIPGTAYCTEGGDVAVAESRPRIEDLDRLPHPAGCLDADTVGIDLQLQAEFILTARGCPYSCHFCSSPEFWGRRVRYRSPASIVEEILSVRDRFGLIYFSLRDDTFTADRRRTEQFCRLLIERRAGLLWNCQSSVNALNRELLVLMKRAGCECIQLGVESGSPRLLKRLGKPITIEKTIAAAEMIREIGINLSIYLISDVPGETDDDNAHTRELIHRVRPDDGYVSPLAYYPGTRLFRDAVDSGSVGESLFEVSRSSALYAVPGGRASRRLLKEFTGLPQPDPKRFERQKRALGYCHTTNVLAGEWLERSGHPEQAMREYWEITQAEPENPWGWFLLGEVLLRAGNRQEGCACHRRVLELVPRHGPSREALGMKNAEP